MAIQPAPRGATPPAPDRLVSLGGASRRYLDPQTELSYSRRQAEPAISGTTHIARAPGSRAEYWQRIEQYRAHLEDAGPIGGRAPSKMEVAKSAAFKALWDRYAHPEKWARREGTQPGRDGQSPADVQRVIALRLMGQRAEAERRYREAARR